MEEHEKQRPEHALVEPMFAALLEPSRESGTKRRRGLVLAGLVIVAVGLAALAASLG